MSGVHEYLEKQFADAFKREADQEENVVRSLPFFAAALALIGAMIGLVAREIPHSAATAHPLLMIAAKALMAVTLAMAVGVVVYLFNAVRPRRFRLPPREDRIIQYAAQLEAYHKGAGLTDDAVQNAVVADLREMNVHELAAAIVVNRANNVRRNWHRFHAFVCLTIGLLTSFLTVALLVVIWWV